MSEISAAQKLCFAACSRGQWHSKIWWATAHRVGLHSPSGARPSTEPQTHGLNWVLQVCDRKLPGWQHPHSLLSASAKNHSYCSSSISVHPVSLTEFPASIWAIQDKAQAAAVAEQQHWKHIQRVRKAKFGLQAFFLPLQYFFGLIQMHPAKICPHCTIIPWAISHLPFHSPVEPNLQTLLVSNVWWNGIFPWTLGEVMAWQGWSISMAEMMLSCAVPPIPSWSLDPNVTNFSAFYGSERQEHAVIWERVMTDLGKGEARASQREYSKTEEK